MLSSSASAKQLCKIGNQLLVSKNELNKEEDSLRELNLLPHLHSLMWSTICLMRKGKRSCSWSGGCSLPYQHHDCILLLKGVGHWHLLIPWYPPDTTLAELARIMHSSKQIQYVLFKTVHSMLSGCAHFDIVCVSDFFITGLGNAPHLKFWFRLSSFVIWGKKP